MLPRSFFQRDPVTCARDLIGKVFHWNGCSGVVVETEAYTEAGDEASHLFFRPSSRAFVNAHPAGTAYVYLNYGMYWLTNVLIKDGDQNGFVLLRALEPLAGLQLMKKRRTQEKLTSLCSGPGKLSMALGITGEDHGRSLVRSSKRGFAEPPEPWTGVVVDDIRIGITRSAELRWRFLAKDNVYVSVKRQNFSLDSASLEKNF